MSDDAERRVRERAYYLWEKEGSPPGRDQEFWERARLLEDAGEMPGMVTPLQSRSAAEAEVDEAMKETFPASDPPSFAATERTGDSPEVKPAAARQSRRS